MEPPTLGLTLEMESTDTKALRVGIKWYPAKSQEACNMLLLQQTFIKRSSLVRYYEITEYIFEVINSRFVEII